MLVRSVETGVLKDVDRHFPTVVEVLVEVRSLNVNVFNEEVVGCGNGE